MGVGNRVEEKKRIIDTMGPLKTMWKYTTIKAF